ncbi:MAG: NIPSNAP family protein [Maribacter sp.]|nr:NIPSNAP family protein [Maribacter sp.]
MKKLSFAKILICSVIFVGLYTSAQSQNIPREFYQLKTYILENDKQEALTDAYLKNAYLPALKKIGIDKVGVFKVRSNKFTLANKIYVLIPFKSLDQLYSVDRDLSSDATYVMAGESYLKAPHDTPPYLRMESTILRAFKDMPMMRPSAVEGAREDRIYELRSYESATEEIYKNKVEMFNAGGEIALFEALGFNAVFYAEVLSGNKMPNLMYMTTFKNQEVRDERWKAFGAAPKWKELSAMPKYQNNVSHIDRMFLYPTDYSDY